MRLLILAVVAVFMVGCGGSGGSDGDTTNPPPPGADQNPDDDCGSNCGTNNTGRLTLFLEFPQEQPSFFPDHRIITVNVVTPDGEEHSQVWNEVDEVVVFPDIATGDYAVTVLIEVDGETVAQGYAEGTINIFGAGMHVEVIIHSQTPGALPPGSGTFSIRGVGRTPYKINEFTGILDALPSFPPGHNFSAASVDHDGYVIAVSGEWVGKIDLLQGIAAKLFDAPEKMTTIAVAPDGTLVTTTQDEEFGMVSVYRFTPEGAVLSKMPVEEIRVNGLAYDADDRLIAVSLMGTWVLDPETGLVENLHLGNPGGLNDIDINESNELRMIESGGTLLVYDLDTGELINETVLQHSYFSFSPLVHR